MKRVAALCGSSQIHPLCKRVDHRCTRRYVSRLGIPLNVQVFAHCELGPIFADDIRGPLYPSSDLAPVAFMNVERITNAVHLASLVTLVYILSSSAGITITCGQAMNGIGSDAVCIQSPKVSINPGETIVSSVVLGDGVPATLG